MFSFFFYVTLGSPGCLSRVFGRRCGTPWAPLGAPLGLDWRLLGVLCALLRTLVVSFGVLLGLLGILLASPCDCVQPLGAPLGGSWRLLALPGASW